MNVQYWISDMRREVSIGKDKITVYGSKEYVIFCEAQVIEHGFLYAFKDISLEDLGNVASIYELLDEVDIELRNTLTYKEEKLKKMVKLLNGVVDKFGEVRFKK